MHTHLLQRLMVFLFLAWTVSTSSSFAACAWPSGPTARVPALLAYPGGVVGPAFVDVQSHTGAPDLQALDCHGTANPEVFVHSSPTVFDFVPACPKSGVQLVRIRFDTPTGTEWMAIDPAGTRIGPVRVFPAGVHTVVWYAPVRCISHVVLLGTGGVESGAKDVCIRRLCYRCKPTFNPNFPGSSRDLADPAGVPTWNLEVPVGEQSVEVETEIQLTADLEPIDFDDDLLPARHRLAPIRVAVRNRRRRHPRAFRPAAAKVDSDPTPRVLDPRVKMVE